MWISAAVASEDSADVGNLFLFVCLAWQCEIPHQAISRI